LKRKFLKSPRPSTTTKKIVEAVVAVSAVAEVAEITETTEMEPEKAAEVAVVVSVVAEEVQAALAVREESPVTMTMSTTAVVTKPRRQAKSRLLVLQTRKRTSALTRTTIPLCEHILLSKTSTFEAAFCMKM
jgi:hypothetical protein